MALQNHLRICKQKIARIDPIWVTFKSYKNVLLRYDLRCLKATLNPNKQT